MAASSRVNATFTPNIMLFTLRQHLAACRVYVCPACSAPCLLGKLKRLRPNSWKKDCTLYVNSLLEPPSGMSSKLLKKVLAIVSPSNRTPEAGPWCARTSSWRCRARPSWGNRRAGRPWIPVTDQWNAFHLFLCIPLEISHITALVLFLHGIEFKPLIFLFTCGEAGRSISRFSSPSPIFLGPHFIGHCATKWKFFLQSSHRPPFYWSLCHKKPWKLERLNQLLLCVANWWQT